MAIITNYPNVPIVTTNVATDSVRNDNEHKSSVAPTDKVTKPHSERAIDPEKEHDAHQQHQQQQDQSQQNQEQEQVSLTETLEKENLKAKEMIAIKNAALSRQDIKVHVDETETQAQAQDISQENKNALKQEDVKQVKRTLNSAYQTQEQKPKSKLNEWS